MITPIGYAGGTGRHRLMNVVHASAVLFSAVLAGCALLPPAEREWNITWPQQRDFKVAYRTDAENQALQSEDEYLTWVLRFYNGWEAYPLGWQSIQSDILAKIDSDERPTCERQLSILGWLIANDWAKDNDVRHIDTRMLSVWGDVIRAATDQDKIPQTIEQVTDDVLELRAEHLSADAITFERYQAKLGLEADTLEPPL